MSHVRVIVLGALNDMKGNASTGSVADLATIFGSVDDLIANSNEPTVTLAHDFCDKVSAFAVGDFTDWASGRGAQYDIAAMSTEGNAILNP